MGEALLACVAVYPRDLVSFRGEANISGKVSLARLLQETLSFRIGGHIMSKSVFSPP